MRRYEIPFFAVKKKALRTYVRTEGPTEGMKMQEIGLWRAHGRACTDEEHFQAKFVKLCANTANVKWVHENLKRLLSPP